MKAGHSPYLQQGTQCLQCSMPTVIINSELNEGQRRCRQPVSASNRNLIKSSSGQGLVACNSGNHVLHLMKTLYGLKQSGHHWYQKLSAIFLSLSFQQYSVNQAVFHKSDKHKKELTVIAVHIDDCTITTTNAHLVKDFKSGLCRHIEVTDLAALHWMLGIEIR